MSNVVSLGPAWQRAAWVTGEENVISPPAVERVLRRPFSFDEMGLLERSPFFEDDLQECRSTHLLIPFPSLLIAEMYSALGLSPRNKWPVSDPRFLPVKPGWHLVRRGVLPGSHSSGDRYFSWEEQQKLVGGREVVLSPIVAVFAHLIAKATGYGSVVGKPARCDIPGIVVGPSLEGVGIYQEKHGPLMSNGIMTERIPTAVSVNT